MSNSKQTVVESLFHKLWDTPKDKFTWYAILQDHVKQYEEESKIEAIKQFLHEEISERRPYSASRMCEETIKFIETNF